jgi:hypothetical protein
MRWGFIFENYILACYELYKWSVGHENAVPFNDFNERFFYNSLLDKGFLNNEEKALEFFDDMFICCHITPIGIKRFKSFAQSELRTIICLDHTSRREAAISTLENAFFLLHERELDNKKIKTVSGKSHHF